MLEGLLKIARVPSDPGWLITAACLLVLTGWSTTTAAADRKSRPVGSVGERVAGADDENIFTGALRVLTLNVAHGRKDGFNQIFQSKETIRRNLGEIAAVLRRTRADVVALQEADGPSRWSGGFDHVAMLAKEAGYPWHARAGHARSWLFDYGTALLSRRPFMEILRHDFQRTAPSPTKGLLLGQIAWRPNEGVGSRIVVDIVSVHFDFSREKVRKQQMAEVIEVLRGRTNPAIVLGDFNDDWLGEDSVVAQLARRCNLHVFRPTAKDLSTYRSNERRFDWVLLSDELEFVDYNVLPDIVSDHYAVVADISVRNPSKARSNRSDTSSRCTD